MIIQTLARGIGLAWLIALSNIAGADQQSLFKGIWQTETNDEGRALHIEMTPCTSDAAQLCGTIVALVNSDKNELIGRKMIDSMTYKNNALYAGGTIWAPDKDKTYQSKMTIVDSGLKVSGCLLGGLVCRSQIWTRVE